MLKEFITNPVIIGLVAGSIVYAYLSWSRKKYNEKRLKKGKKIKYSDKYDDIIIPIIVAVLVWFIAIGYINYKKTPTQNQTNTLPPTMNPSYKLIADQPSEIYNSFVLVRNGISLPSINEPQDLMPAQDIQTHICPAQPTGPIFGGNQNKTNLQTNHNLRQQNINNNLNNNNLNNNKLNNRIYGNQNNLNPNLINPNNSMNVPDIFIN